LRRRRDDVEYRDAASLGVTAEDAAAALDHAAQVITAARQLLSTGKLDRFV
jgi:hypothetical protein